MAARSPEVARYLAIISILGNPAIVRLCEVVSTGRRNNFILKERWSVV
jgi:hypothetical protein